ncbi:MULTISPECIES: hypothetical protein [Bacillus cereus group]|uniref:hypothetical protein n=1 Tax=Bacillus cereus group TaxID=86661 RepID=UPI001F5B1924|nr:hypothetical protein [Bacillus cereus group sp. N8]
MPSRTSATVTAYFDRYFNSSRKIKEGTYEKVMVKSDWQLGVESLQKIKRFDY